MPFVTWTGTAGWTSGTSEVSTMYHSTDADGYWMTVPPPPPPPEPCDPLEGLRFRTELVEPDYARRTVRTWSSKRLQNGAARYMSDAEDEEGTPRHASLLAAYLILRDELLRRGVVV